MTQLKNIAICIILSLFLFGCEDVIEFNDNQSEPMLVTHIIAMPDSTLYAQITKSVFFLESTSDPLKNKNGNYLGVNNALVKLYVNNVFKENMTLVSGDSGIYKANYIPQENEEIRVIVSSPSFTKEAEGKTILPKKTSMTVDTVITYNQEYSMIYDETGSLGYDTIQYKRITYTIHFIDNGADENYYGIEVLDDYSLVSEDYGYYNPDTTDVNRYLSTSDETVFGGSAMEPILIFDDKKINGQSYSFSFYIEDMVNTETYYTSLVTKKRKLRFFSLNKDAYLFMTSAKKNYETSGMSMFSEPSQVYSNIENGIGIIGGYSVVVKEY